MNTSTPFCTARVAGLWVSVEAYDSSPLPANTSDYLMREMPCPPGTSEDDLFIRAAAKALKKAKPCWRYANSPSL